MDFLALARKKLTLYVAPNSIAVHQGEDGARIGGVTYSGDLLVYRLGPNGAFEEDVAFRPMPIARSDCLAAVAFVQDAGSGEVLQAVSTKPCKMGER